MRRRHLLALLGGMLVPAPLPAFGQTSRTYTIGILVPGLAQAKTALHFFPEGLRKLGYVEGKNLRLEIRSADGDIARLPALAAELVRDKVDLIAPLYVPATLAAKHATSVIPIVMLGAAEPVATGIVASLSRPGGNITGMAALGDNVGKTVEFLKDAVPGLRRVAALLNTADSFSKILLKHIQDAGSIVQIEVVPFFVKAGPELDAAFPAMVQQGVGAVIVEPTLPAKEAADLAIRHRLPSGSLASAFCLNGGLLAYAAKAEDIFQHAAALADKVLKGAKPADLPVEIPTTFELFINLKTAKAIGLTLPPSLLARADQVIE